MSPKVSLRKNIHNILEITWHRKLGLSFWVNIFLTIIISLNAIAIILDTVPSIHNNYHQILLDFEVFSVIVFTIEYILRLWSCVENPAFSHPVKGRLKFILSAWGLVDLLSIAPFYVSIFITDLGFIRILRLLRMLRLFRVSKYFHALRVIQKVMKEKQEELVLSFVFIVFVLIISSSTLYYFEHEVQPQKFSSIPESMWWGVNAMTTVGDADFRPITPMGKLIGGLIAILGVALFALPTGILASGFAEQMRGNRQKIKCPHCGSEFHHSHTINP
ncbi:MULTISPECIES: ion transporter [Emticicia]|uniref:ion transporter n=1 Tax=Emticicia TaxID=312278 RepID=UPI0007D8C7EC|nr:MULTISPECIES: ion transporter [Emticicia]